MTAELMRMLSGGMGQRIGWALVHFLWQGALVAGVMGAVLQMLRRRSPQARYAAACLGLAAMVILPIVTAGVIAVREAPAAVAPGAGGQRAMLPDPMGEPGAGKRLEEEADDGVSPVAPRPAREVVAPRGVLPAQARAAWMERARGWVAAHLPWAVLAWMAGAAGLSLWHVGGWVVLRRMRRGGKLPGDPGVAEMFEKLMARMKVRRAVRLLESALVKTPLAIGWMKPVILLPLGALSGLSMRQVEAILAHELAHVRRWDCLVRMLQAGVETVLFFHPAVWWMSGRVTQESEHCCDEIAVAICGDREGYARALAQVAGAWSSPRGALAAAASGGKLLPRLRRILGVGEERRSGRMLPAALAGLALVVGVVVGPLACSMYSRPTTQAANARAIVRAKIIFYYDEAGHHLTTNKTLDVDDAKQLATLAAFFPEMGKGKEAWMAGGWKSGVEIKFSRADGKVLPVAVSENDDLKIWSEGHGDWNVHGDLKAYLKTLNATHLQTTITLPASISKEEAIKRAAAAIGLTHYDRKNVRAYSANLTAEVIPFLGQKLEGKWAWVVDFSGVSLAAGKKANGYIRNLKVLLSPDSGQVLTVTSAWPEKIPSMAPIPPAAEIARQWMESGEKFVSLPDAAPRQTLVQALQNPDTEYWSEDVKQIVAYYVNQTTPEYANRPVWVIQLRGFPPYEPMLPPGELASSVPVEARDHMTNVIDAETGKWLGSDSAPQPIEPAWNDFEKLLGQPFDSASVKAFAENYDLKRYRKFDSGGFENYEHCSFSLLYRENRISRVIVTINREKGDSFPRAPVYSGTLPKGVKPDDSPEDVIRRLGPPTHRPEPYDIKYDSLGLVFSFDRATHKLVEIDIDPPSAAPATAPAATRADSTRGAPNGAHTFRQ